MNSHDLDNPFIECEVCETSVRFNDYITHVDECLRYRSMQSRYRQPTFYHVPSYDTHANHPNVEEDDEDEEVEHSDFQQTLANLDNLLQLPPLIFQPLLNNEIEQSTPQQLTTGYQSTITQRFNDITTTMISQTFSSTQEHNSQTTTIPFRIEMSIQTNSDQHYNTNDLPDEESEEIPLSELGNQDTPFGSSGFNQLVNTVINSENNENNENNEGEMEVHQNPIRHSDNINENEGEMEGEERANTYNPFVNNRHTMRFRGRNSLFSPRIILPPFQPTTRNEPLTNYMVALMDLTRNYPNNPTLTRAEPYNEYEFNLMLSNLVGNVEKGIDNLDNVSKVINSANEFTKNESCAICQDELQQLYDQNIILRKLTCNHTYCEKCIKTWLEKNVRCPVCNTKPPKRKTKTLP